MIRCPVWLQLALLVVAPLADDLRTTVQLLDAGTDATTVVTTDRSIPLTVARLVDSAAGALENARGGRPNRDVAANPFAAVSPSLHTPCEAVAASDRPSLTAPSTLVTQHIRLQV